MKIIKGIPVSPGYAIDRAVVMDGGALTVSERRLASEHVPAELQRIDRAFHDAIEEAKWMMEKVGIVSKDMAPILQAHVAMLMDPVLRDEVRNHIKNDLYTAEYAVNQTIQRYVKELMSVEDDFFSHRINDIRDIEKRLAAHLGEAQIPVVQEDGVLIAHDLTPSQTAMLDTRKIKGIATETGGRTSHTAIMARALGIPAVVGLPNICSDVIGGDRVVIDGVSGRVVINPDPETLKKYRVDQRSHEERLQALETLIELDATTKDGVKVEIMANIEFPTEIDLVLRKGGRGVGLFRTEFMYADPHVNPDEEFQFNNYRKSLSMLQGRPLVIRTLDIGGDKFFQDVRMGKEKNPFLGCRSIRLCLERLDIFKPQLRALLRASAEGPLWILLPMISSVDELKKVRLLIDDLKAQLKEEGERFNANVPLGIMVEIPSAVVILDMLVDMVDFVSIGTNDLVQYTLAVDRVNDSVADYYQVAHPAILRMIKQVVDICEPKQKHVTLCGEMAADPVYTPLLVGLGVHTFSVSPFALLEVKEVVRTLDMPTAKSIAEKCLTFTRQKDINQYLKTQLRKLTGKSSA